MHASRSAKLRVPDAHLYYEVRGAGPPLLLIHGGMGDAGTYAGLAAHLADRYTVISYDRRGHSRSTLDRPDIACEITEHANDAHRLIRELTQEPAFVFGSSSGAVIGLDLLARYPKDIARLVAHEPPSVLFLSDAAKWEGFFADVYATYSQDGLMPALLKFVAGIGMDRPPKMEPGVQMPPPNLNNMRLWFETELRTAPNFPLDLPALAAAADRLVIAGGRDGKTTLAYLTGAAVAARLGCPFVEFPGTHISPTTLPTQFGEALDQSLIHRS